LLLELELELVLLLELVLELVLVLVLELMLELLLELLLEQEQGGTKGQKLAPLWEGKTALVTPPQAQNQAHEKGPSSG